MYSDAHNYWGTAPAWDMISDETLLARLVLFCTKWRLGRIHKIKLWLVSQRHYTTTARLPQHAPRPAGSIAFCTMGKRPQNTERNKTPKVYFTTGWPKIRRTSPNLTHFGGKNPSWLGRAEIDSVWRPKLVLGPAISQLHLISWSFFTAQMS